MQSPISLRIEIDPGKLCGKVLLQNEGKADVNVWATGNAWGDYALSFEIETDAGTVRVEKSPQIYTRNVPSTVRISPGKYYAIPFQVYDGSWRISKQLSPRITQITAVYNVAPTPDAKARSVFSGSVKASQAVAQ